MIVPFVYFFILMIKLLWGGFGATSLSAQGKLRVFRKPVFQVS